MQLNGLLHGSRLLAHVDFPTSEVLGPDASEDAIQGLIDRHGLIFIKPVFRGGVGKKGKAGLVGKARTLKEALAEKERLYFCEHRHGNAFAKANGVTFEAGVPAEHEVYFSITDDTRFRAPTMTLTHRGGMDIEELPKSDVATVPFEALTGLKAFVVANALTDIGAPKEIISPLVQHLPKLWELVHHYGMTTLELNPIRMRPGPERAADAGRLRLQVRLRPRRPAGRRGSGCRTSCSPSDVSAFEQEVNQLRTHQGQSDVFVINEQGTILAPTFGGGANSPRDRGAGRGGDHLVGLRRQPALREDEGGRRRSATGTSSSRPTCSSSSAASRTTPTSSRPSGAWATRCASISPRTGPTPLYVVVGRGGPNLVRGMGNLAETLESLGLPYRFFGFDSAISEVVNYAKRVDEWMRAGGREEIAASLGLKAAAETGYGAQDGEDMFHQGIQGIPYYLGIRSLAEIATREDRVCVLNIMGGESRQVTPTSHAFSGGNVVFGTSPGRAGRC